MPWGSIMGPSGVLNAFLRNYVLLWRDRVHVALVRTPVAFGYDTEQLPGERDRRENYVPKKHVFSHPKQVEKSRTYI